MEENFKNMKGQLEIMKTLGIKPNYSELERAFKINRHTIKKYYEEIKSKIELCGVNQIGIYQYLLQKDSSIGSYSNFKKYLTKHNLKPNKKSKAHLRYETSPRRPITI